ncbi:MAG: PAS domain-containing protein [Chloroflexi bacterium]|nr:PAS domain-containing protein [Chloroflexota bacterium]
MTWHYQYIPFIWLIISSAVVVVGLGVYCLRHRSTPGALALAAAMFVSVLFVLGIGMEALAVEPPAKFFWSKFQEFWLFPTVITALWFAVEYANLGRWLTPRTLAWLFVPMILKFALGLTNDLHHWMWLPGATDTAGRGPVMWALIGYGYLLVALHAAVLVWLFLKSARHRWPAALLLFSRLTTAVFFGISMAELDAFPPTYLKLAAVMVAVLSHSIAFFGFGILDPIPGAHQKVLEQMHEGMLVLDTQQRVVDMNPPAERIFHLSLTRARGRSVAWVPGLASLTADQREIVLGEGGAARHFALYRSALTDPRGFPLGMLILFHDVTEQKQTQAQLLEQERAIAALEERQRLARELHDGLGQVLGYVGFQAEAARILYHDGKSSAGDEHLARLVGVAQNAHADLREFILNLRMGPSSSQPFFPTLQKYVDSFSKQYGIRTTLSIEEGLDECSFEAAARLQLFRIIQEALSNARRHAAPGTIQVSFESVGRSARIMVRDDGCGFEAGLPTGRSGFGLDFMRERAEQLGGDLQLQSRPGAGTCIIVEIPLETGAAL